jgi:hypothetical protein
MFEFQDSASMASKDMQKEKRGKQEQSPNNNYSLCGLNLGVARLRDILENIPSAVLIVEKTRR